MAESHQKHNHNHHSDNHSDHNHGGIFGEKTELVFAIISGIFFFVGLSIEHLLDLNPWFAKGSFILSILFGGFFTTKEAITKISKGEFEIDFLMLVAAAGAVYIDKWEEAALLLFLFSLGHALEHYAMSRAKKNIESLGNLTPKTALVKNGNSAQEIAVEELKINDIIVVQPNTKIAADGVLIKGNSHINQASITGESMPVEKTAFADENIPEFDQIDKSHVVYTGTINGDSVIEVKVLKLTKDSTISRLVQMVSEVEGKKSPTQLMTKKFEKWYVPAVIILVVLLCFAYLVINETFEESLYRAITVLVAASPCALAISTPSAVLSGVARAAKSGVLIKGGRALENLGGLNTVAFDKTGTLTEGKPKLTNLIPLENISEGVLVKIVAEVEELSNHPLAKAITNGIKEKFGDVTQNLATNIQAIQGMGVSADYQQDKIYIGNEALMEKQAVTIGNEASTKFNSLLEEGHTTMFVAKNKDLIGIISVMDLPRETAANTLKELKEIGIENMIMLTGDHQNIGNHIAQQIGLTEAKGDLLPEDKVTEITNLVNTYEKVAMVGDGVNDAPAMAKSTVGIAMGAAGSDVALETADVALMSDRIERLPFVIGLSRASKKIIRQNLILSLGMVAFLIPATLFGFASIGPAVMLHEGSTLVVVFNALRLLAYKDKFV